MLRKILALGVILILLLLALFWYAGQQPQKAQTVNIKENWASYLDAYCYIKLTFYAMKDGTKYPLEVNLKFTMPDGKTGQMDTTQTDFNCRPCNKDWEFVITPKHIKIPNIEPKSVDGEPQTYIKMVPKGTALYVDFVFEWR